MVSFRINEFWCILKGEPDRPQEFLSLRGKFEFFIIMALVTAPKVQFGVLVIEGNLRGSFD